MSKAFICGVSGIEVSPQELSFLSREKPWGFILFGRNCQTQAQIIDLVASLRQAVGDLEAPVLIDQEGGRVQRIKPPLMQKYPAGRLFGDIFKKNPTGGRRAAYLAGWQIARELNAFDIDVNCLPLADIPVAGADTIIGDRAYGTDADTVIEIAQSVTSGLLAGGVKPILKHLPGHGRAPVDSHIALPIVKASHSDLGGEDFVAFRALNNIHMGMTAHVVFESLDPRNPATLSPTIIEEIIRGEIGFDGLLMSDDISMKALDGDIGDLSGQAISAGCDIVLHCNGILAEMEKVASAVPQLTKHALRRASAAQFQSMPRVDMDFDEVSSEFNTLCRSI